MASVLALSLRLHFRSASDRVVAIDVREAQQKTDHDRRVRSRGLHIGQQVISETKCAMGGKNDNRETSSVL